ncbi:CRISPR-associated endoribonuclease Cas6 [Thermovibrio ammonificans]|uniref:CRISPR-associated protein Cas6 n=1 Tax=Thermovibrio ammonificans (strain DSM 15698 / JCM 12110 / HB-1) TaxID=648996 RepID=E8T547_THEA1|nr:CRISPR-associated endoribonuclease Cas6 [Thermovibrio ammonificans]ADU97579.1 CRISPR-associated protein Cas6 [Thermovibrio ammonificans HB-1]
MRLKITFIAESVPILYRHRIVSLFKESVKRTDPSYFRELYSFPTPKPYTFSLALPRGFILKQLPVQVDSDFTPETHPEELSALEVFEFPNGGYISLLVSTSDYRFLVSLVNGLVRLGRFNFTNRDEMVVGGKSLSWEVVKVAPLPERRVQELPVTVRTLSPILVEERGGNPILPDNPRFNEAVNFVVNRRLKLLRGRGLRRPIALEPLKVRKKVVKHTFSYFRRRTGRPIMYLTCSEGTFKLYGDREDINFLLDTGIGNKTGQGFGMVEVVS